jgi:hypothetical protein
VRRFERRTTFLQRSGYRFRETTQSDANAAARRAKSCRNEMFAEENGRKIVNAFLPSLHRRGQKGQNAKTS